jgi:hypothetical protein
MTSRAGCHVDDGFGGLPCPCMIKDAKAKWCGSAVASFECTAHIPKKYGNLVNLSYLRDPSAKLDCPPVGEGERGRV